MKLIFMDNYVEEDLLSHDMKSWLHINVKSLNPQLGQKGWVHYPKREVPILSIFLLCVWESLSLSVLNTIKMINRGLYKTQRKCWKKNCIKNIKWSLKIKLENKIKTFRDDKSHARTPASLKYLRERVKVSIDLYEHYLK